VTSTAGWDTLRAVTTIIGITVVGRAVLAAFRRVKPVSSVGGRTAQARSTQARDRLHLGV
jgi:energy-coupling factor transport system ATP-binding protein